MLASGSPVFPVTVNVQGATNSLLDVQDARLRKIKINTTETPIQIRIHIPFH
jgi:hypothetical protein